MRAKQREREKKKDFPLQEQEVRRSATGGGVFGCCDARRKKKARLVWGRRVSDGGREEEEGKTVKSFTLNRRQGRDGGGKGGEGEAE